MFYIEAKLQLFTTAIMEGEKCLIKTLISFYYFFLEVITFKRESDFQKDLKKELIERFPGCIIFKCDPVQRQGTPDLVILYKHHWAALEVKQFRRASKRPNQDLRVDEMNRMSFAAIIYPENKEKVLNDLERFFETG